MSKLQKMQEELAAAKAAAAAAAAKAAAAAAEVAAAVEEEEAVGRDATATAIGALVAMRMEQNGEDGELVAWEYLLTISADGAVTCAPVSRSPRRGRPRGTVTGDILSSPGSKNRAIQDAWLSNPGISQRVLAETFGTNPGAVWNALNALSAFRDRPRR